MKKSIIFLLALLTLCACDTDDPEGPEGKEVKYYSTTPEHFSYQVGFTDAASANLYETNEYAVISQSSVWEYNWAFIPSVVKNRISAGWCTPTKPRSIIRFLTKSITIQ